MFVFQLSILTREVVRVDCHYILPLTFLLVTALCSDFHQVLSLITYPDPTLHSPAAGDLGSRLVLSRDVFCKQERVFTTTDRSPNQRYSLSDVYLPAHRREHRLLLQRQTTPVLHGNEYRPSVNTYKHTEINKGGEGRGVMLCIDLGIHAEPIWEWREGELCYGLILECRTYLPPLLSYFAKSLFKLFLRSFFSVVRHYFVSFHFKSC